MKDSLIGNYVHSVDEKGRLAIPSKMRVELGERFYIAWVNKDCLSIYSEEQWKVFAEKLNAIPQSDTKAQEYVRLIFSNACKCEPDKQGRVLLPQQLREKVGIDKEAVVVGASFRAEIWANDKWQAFEEKMASSGIDAMTGLAGYGV